MLFQKVTVNVTRHKSYVNGAGIKKNKKNFFFPLNEDRSSLLNDYMFSVSLPVPLSVAFYR